MAVLAFTTRWVAALMTAAAIVSLFGTVVQFVRIQNLLEKTALHPQFDREVLYALTSFGLFSWLQAVAGVLFSQVDRLVLGVSMGAVAVAAYALCSQVTQPIYGVAASGLHFLFPLLASRRTVVETAELRKIVGMATLANVVFVAMLSAGMMLAGPWMLRLLAGGAVARSAESLLDVMICGSALLGLNVTATYSLLALGRVRTVTWLNIGGGVLMLVAIALLVRKGPQGVAIARLCYGAITLFLYVPLAQVLRAGASNGGSVTPRLAPAEEEA
jgi:O-antigen/teichoic acid export membrane protein